MYLSAAWAAPPLSQRAAHVGLRAPLDLRSPVELHASQSFPSSLHRQTLGGQVQEHNELAAMASLGTQSRLDSPMQALAHRVHREGLPVARLWENKSALLSLGLNQKGKPGLWLIQKIH